jgi:hypothetical protein
MPRLSYFNIYKKEYFYIRLAERHQLKLSEASKSLTFDIIRSPRYQTRYDLGIKHAHSSSTQCDAIRLS